MLTSMMIGKMISEARKEKKLSQAQLAQQLSITSQAVGKWERGESMPDIITFNRLAEVLGVDMNYFSENFQSSKTEITAVETSPENAPEPDFEKATKKLDWDMSSGNWIDADFSGLMNLHEKFNSSNLQKCLFVGSDMSGLLLKANNVVDCDFSNSDISNSRIRDSSLVNDIFKNCALKDAEFSGSQIKNCDFQGADFSGAVIKSSSFLKSTVVNALWNRTSFKASQISDVVFDDTFTDCSFENCALTRVTFRNVTLNNTFFKNTNLKRVLFIDCKADKLTYAFLKSGKADLSGITLLTP